MNLRQAIESATRVAGEQAIQLGPLKSSIFEFGDWILCFHGHGQIAEWWATIDDLDGETTLTARQTAYKAPDSPQD